MAIVNAVPPHFEHGAFGKAESDGHSRGSAACLQDGVDCPVGLHTPNDMEFNSRRQERFSVSDCAASVQPALMVDWHHRLAAELERRGWAQAELARRSGVPEQSVYKYLQGRVRQPRGDVLPRLAHALGVNAVWLRDGLGPRLAAVAIVGYVGAGETFIPTPDEQMGELAVDFEADDPIAVVVRGSSMAPVYRPGDYLLCSRINATDAAQFINKDCVLLTTSGLGFVKKVVKGSEQGRHTLLSYNADPIENEALAWVAPVLWIKRA